jgi:hypothetical protein
MSMGAAAAAAEPIFDRAQRSAQILSQPPPANFSGVKCKKC